MQFLHPLNLTLLGLLLIVAVAYLLRLPRQRLRVPDAQIARRVLADMPRINRRRRALLSLAIQAVILTLLALAAARPSWIGDDPPGERSLVVLLDMSASMRCDDSVHFSIPAGDGAPSGSAANSGATRFAKAVAAVRGLARSMRAGDRMMIIGVRRTVDTIANFQSDPEAISRTLDNLAVSAEPANFPQACSLAAEIARSSESAQVVLVTDGALRPGDLAGLASLPGGRIKLVKVGAASGNMGITNFRVRRNLDSPTDYEAVVSLASTLDEPRKIDVTLQLDGTVFDVASVEVPARGQAVQVFREKLHVGGLLEARLNIVDALADDNSAAEVLRAARRLRVLLVTDDTSASSFLVRAVGSNAGAVEGMVITPEQYRQNIAPDPAVLAGQRDAIIFDRWAPASEAELPPVHVLAVDCVPPGMPVQAGEAFDKPLIRKWEQGHPLMSYLNLRDVFISSARKLAVTAAPKGQPPIERVAELVTSPLVLAWQWQVSASREGDSPVFVPPLRVGTQKSGQSPGQPARTRPQRFVVLGFDPRKSDIVLRKELPLLVWNSFLWFSNGVESPTQASPGQTITLETADWPETSSVRVTLPDGTVQSAAVDDSGMKAAFSATAQPGVYRYGMGNVQDAFVVNCGQTGESDVRPAEDLGIQTEPLDAANLAARAPATARSGRPPCWRRWCCWFSRRSCSTGESYFEMWHIELTHPWAVALLVALLPAAWFTWRTYDPMRRGRKALVLAARLLVIAAAVAGLAAVRWVHHAPPKRLGVLAVLDISRSVSDASLDEAVEKLDQLFAQATPDRSVGLIVFAGDAKVALPLGSAAPPAGAVRKAIELARSSQGGMNLEATNVERALDLAMASFAPDTGRRIVLLSDGNANDGQTQAKLARCREQEIEICVAPLSQERSAFDLAVTGVVVPTGLQPGVGFDVAVQTAAQSDAPARLALYRNGYLLEERAVDLPAGAHTETFRQRLDEPGLYLYRARLTTDRKQASLENDSAYAFTRLRTAAKVLVMGEAEVEAASLLPAIRAAGMTCEFRTADAAPERLSDLLDFDAVVLNNLRASSLDGPRQRMLRDYVELFGGGLLVIGLDALGGYAGTPLEDALPVVCSLDRLTPVSASVVVIADTSRSLILADASERRADAAPAATPVISRPEIIKATTRQVLAGLSERDTFGLIGFGSEIYGPRWIVPPQKVYDRKKIEWNIENHLLTAPRFDDPQALADLIARMTRPAEPVEPAQLAQDIEAIADPQHLPHLTAGALMPYLRKKLKITAPAVNPEELTQAVERLLEPNAFLARSNAARSILRAVNELKQRQTATKRIIMLSDGYLEGGDKAVAPPEPQKGPRGKTEVVAVKPGAGGDVDYERLAGQLASDGITLSTVALKYADANRRLLDGIAQWGLGQAYRLDDPAAFSEQFRKELEAVARPRVMEFPLRAQKAADSAVLRGVDVAVAPQLFGYVRAAPKLGARNVLVVPPDYEPLLTTWDFGAGRAAVFTSDAQALGRAVDPRLAARVQPPLGLGVAVA